MDYQAILFLIVFLLQNILTYGEDCKDEHSAAILKSILLNEATPLRVTAFLCYKKEILVKFVKCLSPVSISFEDFSFFNLRNITEIHTAVFILDMKCSESKSFLEKKVRPKYFSHPFKWILLNDLDSSEKIPNIKALTDSNILLVSFRGDIWGTYELENFYQIEENSEYIFEPYGNWSSEKGFTLIQKEMVLSKRRRDLQGKILKTSIVITHNESLYHLEDYKEKHIDSIGKMNYILVKSLIKSVNGTMKYNVVGTWGYKDATTGKWSGMVGDLVSGKAEIGGTGLFLTQNRIHLIEYISMVTPTRAVFVFREPPLSYVTNIYYLPFHKIVWICSGILVAMAIFVILLTMKFEYKLEQNMDDDTEPKQIIRFSDGVILGIGAICQMGTLINPKILSSRISTIFLLITLLFLYTSYTANIVALLQSTTKTIRSLPALLQSQINLGAEDTPYNRYYLPMMNDPVRKAIYEEKLSKKGVPRYMNITTGISLVREGLFGFFVEEGPGYRVIEETFFEHEKCNLMRLEYIPVVDPWLSIKKFSPYKEMLKVNLFRIREGGLQFREYSKIYTRKPICAAAGQSFGSVRLIDCYAALVVLAIGYGLALIILILEKLFRDNSICLI